VILPVSGGTVTFKYDPFGRRIQKSSASGTTNYLYDGVNMIEEVNSTGTLLARYTQNQGVDEPLAQLRSGAISYYEQDGLSSVSSLSNSSGTLINTYVYDSFGNLSTSTGTVVNSFQYTGRDFDPETGLRYYRARYYDPTIGRFSSEDPEAFSSGVNFYEYVDNDPVQWTDPHGLTKCKKGCGIKKGPAYSVTGTVPLNTLFTMHAEFLNDDTHDPRCCEVRQLVMWNKPLSPTQSAPHAGFAPPRDKPGVWYEDRNIDNQRYGRKPGGKLPAMPSGFSFYGSDSFDGSDMPGAEQLYPGVIFSFQLVVIDVCNGGNTAARSKRIKVNFGGL
jgi:RHS repeat-associated protein